MDSMRSAVLSAFKGRSDFLTIRLTGRTGSGCTTAGSILGTQKFDDVRAALPLDHPPERRKQTIVLEFASKNWQPFRVVSVSTVILSFLIHKTEASILESLQSSYSEKQSDKKNFVANQLADFVKTLRPDWSRLSIQLDRSQRPIEREIEDLFQFIDGPLAELNQKTRTLLGPDVSRVLQGWGDNIRLSGDASKGQFDAEKFFSLPQRIYRLSRLWNELCRFTGTQTRFAIDALRNPLEIVYLRQKLPAFLCVGITTDDDDRKQRLSAAGHAALAIDQLDQKEYPSQNKPLSGTAQFVSQNIQSCLEKADVLIRNPGRAKPDEAADLRPLSYQLVKYVSLAIHPALITPSRDERCMELAFVAKANSGCISRQVGAVVTDQSYSVISIGWNDVAQGQVPCALRNVDDLLRGHDDHAYSDYERKNKEFRRQIEKDFGIRSNLGKDGLPCPYCFKDEYNTLKKDKNQVHTRSLHAEENAFLQVSMRGGTPIRGGILFSTASPCELCSKKAFQLGIRRIVYVDPYPGISNDHVLASGEPSSRPVLELFSGAVGRAYHWFYGRTVPLKDELRARMDMEGLGVELFGSQPELKSPLRPK